MENAGLEILFKRLLVAEPMQEDIDRITEYPGRDDVIRFLIGKIDEYLEEDQPESYYRRLERSVTAACFVLGELRAEEAVGPLVGLLDLVKESYDSALCMSTIEALKAIGEPALVPVHEKYMADRHDDIYAMVWVDVLVGLKVKDVGIKTALIEYFSLNPSLAAQYMAAYGDNYFLPLIEKYVECLAGILNDNELDPLDEAVEEQEPVAADYMDARDALVALRGTPIDSEEFDVELEALDRKLLRFSKFGG